MVTSTPLFAVLSPVTVFAALEKRSWFAEMVEGYVADVHEGSPPDTVRICPELPIVRRESEPEALP